MEDEPWRVQPMEPPSQGAGHQGLVICSYMITSYDVLLRDVSMHEGTARSGNRIFSQFESV